PQHLVSSPFEMEWPPRSGRMQHFPEIDRVVWFGVAEARARLLAGQAPFIDGLQAVLAGPD
ncbi:MAG: NUDIX hydrolase, partial [Comamonadaceae bacterium]